MSPPIIINENELFACSNIIINVFKQLENLHQDYIGPHETRYNFPNLTTEAAKAVTDRQNYQKALYESQQRLHQQPNQNFIIKPMENQQIQKSFDQTNTNPNKQSAISSQIIQQFALEPNFSNSHLFEMNQPNFHVEKKIWKI